MTFLNNFAKAEVIDIRPSMNILKYETLPKKLFNSLTVHDSLMDALTVVFAKLTSIPLLWTRNPKNFLAETSKAHFVDSFLA